MMLRTPHVLLSSYTGLSSINTASPHLHQIHTSSTRFDSSRPPSWRHRRGYARVSDDSHDKLTWPETGHPTVSPTPYQIFCQKKGAPYSKRRFYELVKLYHPDWHGQGRPSGVDQLSHTTKLERYRLVVAANDILSDPVKRSAYDRYGAGWNGFPEASGRWNQNTRGYGNGSSANQAWGQGDRSPSQNATWEDWERWYQRDAKGPQQPLYFGNGAFFSLVVMLAALGGVGQATRAGNYSMSFLEERDRLHDETSKELIRRRQDATTYSHRDERIESFLKTRDPDGYGVANPDEDAYRRLSGDREIGSSSDSKGR
ncbi:MAG: hypothetical protein M1838_003931 [Thelocarpon superellum]|nr:MAG: hypothetical protein M1838_003931 [Thelocarpon superellum]